MRQPHKTIALVTTLLVSACSSGPVVQPRDPKPNVAGPTVDQAKSNQGPGKTAPIGPPKPGEAKSEFLFDEVLAIVDADVVTRSTVQEDVRLEVNSKIDQLKEQGGTPKLPPSELRDIERKYVQDRVRQLLLADSIDTLGIDPKAIESTVRRIVAERITDEERKAGGSLEFLERLRERGQTYESYRNETRAQVRQQLSVSEKLRSARTASQLLATPQDLLDYYEAHKAEFVTPARANLELLRFGKKDGKKEPAVRAAEARKSLLKGVAAADVGEAHDAEYRRIDGVRPDGSALELLRNFAFESNLKPGAISEPIERGSETWLIRLAARSPGGVRPFKDEGVQDEIRKKIATKRQNELYLELFQEEQRRTRIWPPDLFR